MKLPNTIISLIFNEIEEIKWSKLYFLFIDEIEWKINHLKDIIDGKKLIKKCENGNIFTIYKNNNSILWWNQGLYLVCKNGYLEIINLIIERGANDWNWGLRGACEGNHLNIINYMVEKGISEWGYVLFYACRGGHLNVVELIIKLSTDYWNKLQKIVKYWNRGLQGACQGGHLNIVKLLIDKGATECYSCKKSMIDHLLKI